MGGRGRDSTVGRSTYRLEDDGRGIVQAGGDRRPQQDGPDPTGTDTAPEPAVDDGTELRAMVHTDASHRVVDPDGTLTVWAGTVQRSGGVDRGPVSGVALSVTLVDPGDATVSSQSATTNADGNAVVDFPLSNAATGTYTVEVTASAAANDVSLEPEVGPYVGVPLQAAPMITGEQTTIGVYAAVGDEPESGVTRDIDVYGPGNTIETVSVAIGNGGVGTFTYTPSSNGSYTFDSPDSPAFGWLFESAEFRALIPRYVARDQNVGDGTGTMHWGGVLHGSAGPESGRDLSVTVTDVGGSTDTTVATRSPTTGAVGGFEVEFPKPTSPTEYQVAVETAAGDPVWQSEERLIFSDPPASSSAVDLGVTVQDYYVAPGGSTTVEVELTDGGSAVSNQSVTLFSTYRSGVPAGSTSVVTGADGTATTSVDAPANAPDGESYRLTAVVDYDGTTHTTWEELEIRQYEIGYSDGPFTPGGTATVSVDAADRLTGDPVQDVDLAVFGTRFNVEAGTFEAAATTTDSSGSGSIAFSVPGDATNRVMFNAVTPYMSPRSSRHASLDTFSPTITVSPSNPAPGDTVTVNYSTGRSGSVTGIGAFPMYDDASVRVFGEGESVDFTVPDHLASGSTALLNLNVVAGDGTVSRNVRPVPLAGGTAPTIGASGESIPAGGQATIDITAGNVDAIAVEDLWTDWDGLVSEDPDGGTVDNRIASDGVYEITYPSTRDSVDASLTVAPPPGTYVGGDFAVLVTGTDGSDADADVAVISLE